MTVTEPQESYEEGEQASDLNRAIGKQVKVLRERAGLTQKELGDRLGYSEDLVSSLERGRRTPQREFLEAADELLDAGGLLKATIEDVEKAKAKARVRHPAWFKDYARLERQAVEINDYNCHDIPGLFQTERRIRALYEMRKPLLDEETIEQRVTSRLARQEILTHWPPPMITAVIEESVLRRPLGGGEVHNEQLEHLLQLGRLRNVELQVMPIDRTEHAGMGGSFILLTPKGKPQLGYTEAQNSSRLATDPEDVRILAAQYGSLRAQALTMQESLALIKKMLGEL
ncbi:helix-turn-helix transcriptional regulator [Streptomyces sp. TLI_185]|uniref:helix-turn-helix domain-containing protein n=1 Tax=Streptomyces sp. TLI_185 TaxID=2485151 RepID=UPI000F4DE1FE|nr:helix-turn-helix transcriptional regulator [Streptomyces sp. TLI_185]